MNDITKSHRDNCAAYMILSPIANLGAMPGKLSRWLDHNACGLAPIFPRVLLAYEFGEAGLEKLHGDNWFADLTFPFPFNLLPADISWTMATGLEIIAPIALILGFMTRFFSVALIVLTVVAMAAVHWPAEWQTLGELWKGYVITDQGYGNYKLPLMYVMMLATLILSGAGRLSLDAWWRHRVCWIDPWFRPNDEQP